MRIRKNNKLTASIIWSTAASPSSPNPPSDLMQSHMCVVNRSRWDAPLSPQPDYPLSPAADAEDSLPSPQHHQYNNNNQVMEEDDAYPPLNDDDDDSPRSIDSMKISSDPYNKSSSSMSILPSPDPTPTPTPTPPSPDRNSCNTKDPKDKAIGPPIGRRRGRPKKVVGQPPPSSSTANPSEFYYYSGFGPRWGKRRGGGKQQSEAANNQHLSNADKRKINAEARVDDELDYIDDDYEDDDQALTDGTRKRTRKLVKARSLKSLM